MLREVLQLRYPKLPDHGSNLHSQNARNAKTIMPKSKKKKGSSSSSHLQRECGQSCHCFLDRDSHHRELAIPFASSTFTYYSHKTQTPKSGAQNHISPHHFLPSFLSSSEFVAMSRYEMKCNVVQLRYPPRILVENPSAATKPPNSPTTKQRATPCATEPKSPSVLACLLAFLFLHRFARDGARCDARSRGKLRFGKIGCWSNGGRCAGADHGMDPEGQGPPFSVHGCLLGCYSGRPSPNTSYLLLYCILYFIHRILVRVSYECVFVSYMFVFRMSFNKYVRLLVQYVPKRTWEHETRSSIRVTRPAVFHPMHPPMSESPV